jgi:hypothetical protein
VAGWLADRDVHFVEIAGNDEILVTTIAPRDWAYNLIAGSKLSMCTTINASSGSSSWPGGIDGVRAGYESGRLYLHSANV